MTPERVRTGRPGHRPGQPADGRDGPGEGRWVGPDEPAERDGLADGLGGGVGDGTESGAVGVGTGGLSRRRSGLIEVAGKTWAVVRGWVVAGSGRVGVV